MWKKLDINKFSIVFVTCMFFIIAALIVWYVTTVDDEILELTRMDMENIGVQMGEQIENSVNENKDDIWLLASYAAKADVRYDNAYNFLSMQSQVDEFENLYYIDINGNGISADGEKLDFSDNETFANVLKTDFCVSKPHVSTQTADLVFDIAVPIIKSNETVGALLAEIPVSDLYEMMDSTAKGGWIFLLDHDLNILFTSSLGHTNETTIPATDIETLGVQKVQEGTQQAIEGKGGSFTYVANYGSGNTEKILVYAPIEMTDWILAISIEAGAVNVDLETTVKYIANIGILILIIITFFIIYIWIYRIIALRSIEKTAYYDALTNLPNLIKLKKDMSNVLINNKTKRYSVVKIDIENFKAINEMFGFEIGNRVLQAFKTIRETVPEPTLEISRTGVDEFILFSGNGFLDDMEKRTGIYESYYKEFIPELGNYKIDFKYGRYHIPLGEKDVDDIINKLNLAHRIAKDNKGMIIYDYDESYTRKLLADAELTSKMKDALTNNEFEVYVQPKFALKNDKLIGAEALVRWIEADGKMIYPNAFIPLFEKNGFIVELDRYVLEKVCIKIKKWKDLGFKLIPISVNCSRQNLNDADFVENVIEIVDKHNVPHEFIEVELTETTTIENELKIEALFADLRENGFKISIDDFGAGYSSLGMLKNLKVDNLKMDRSFFTGEKEVARGEYVVDGFVKVAHNLDMYVIAEGIETAQQIQNLKKMDCDAVQGYYYAKPMPFAEFEEKYKTELN